jgi:hypothetical protein
MAGGAGLLAGEGAALRLGAGVALRLGEEGVELLLGAADSELRDAGAELLRAGAGD